MKYLLQATLFGTVGWLVALAVLERTGSAVLAAFAAAGTCALMIWGFDLRRKLDEN